MAFNLVDVGGSPCQCPGEDLLRDVFDHVPVDVVPEGFWLEQVLVDLELATLAVCEDVDILSEGYHIRVGGSMDGC